MAAKLVDWGWPPNWSAYQGSLMTGHNVSNTVFDVFWNKQGGMCGVCRRDLAYPFRKVIGKQGLQPKIDRRPLQPISHKDVRGLLCSECRINVKAALENKEELKKAIRYLAAAGDWE